MGKSKGALESLPLYYEEDPQKLKAYTYQLYFLVIFVEPKKELY